MLSDVKRRGDQAIKEYTEKFDGVALENFTVTEDEVSNACLRVEDDVKEAFQLAAANIEKFHRAQIAKEERIETSEGIVCFRESRPIEKIGLYVPGGTAPLPSTVLMLGVPARLAGCQEVVLCTPPNKEGNVPDTILYTAKLCDITQILKIGGAQAIAALSYGTETIPKVYKIFGPGNQYVTAAKMLLSIEADGPAIDLPAGPSELLVIAGDEARADFVASDLLSQAEHGPDSQVVLLCDNDEKVKEILLELEKQLAFLPRKEIAEKALKKSFAMVVEDLEQALEFSNNYAPEHLILNIENADKYISQVKSAGSVFLGPYSCESAGDYASGTNHTLPTYGYAKNYSGVSIDSFVKKITFQKLSKQGVRSLGPAVEKMAEIEDLFAHKNAMTVRINSLSK